MKKVFKIIGKVLLGLLILIVLFVVIMTIYNQIMLKKKLQQLQFRAGAKYIQGIKHDQALLIIGRPARGMKGHKMPPSNKKIYPI